MEETKMKKIINKARYLSNAAHISYLFKKLSISAILFISYTLYTASFPAYAQDKFFSILISSNKNINSAVEDISRLKKLGHDAFYRDDSIKGKGKWYRVYVGKYESKGEAKEEAKRLKKAGLLSDYSIKALDETTKKAFRDRDLGTKGYYLHVSSFKINIYAEEECRKLEKYGFKTLITPEEVLGKKWFRVYIGTFHDKQEAQKVGSELKKKRIISYFRPTKHDQIKFAGKAEEEYVEKIEEKKTALLAKATEKVVEKKKEQPPETKEAPRGDEKIPAYEAFEKKAQEPSSIVLEAKKEEIKPVQKAISEEPQAIYRDGKSRFAVALKTGAFISPNVEDFKITKKGGSTNEIWRISGDKALQLSVIPSFRINRRLSLDAGFEGIFADGINLKLLTLGPKIMLGGSNSFLPYLKAGAVYGNIDWGDIPGEFDNSIGWEAGFGVCFLKSKFKFGLDFLYRDVQFDYNAPTGQNISANHDAIDFSGYSFSLSLAYFF